MTVLCVFLLLLAGGLATSFAEYHFNYNLFDYLVDFVKGAEQSLAKAEAKVAALKAEIASKV
jgi:hypothetical protein